MSRDINLLTQFLQDKFKELKQKYEEQYKPKTIILTTTHRTPEEQYILYKQGRLTEGKIVTNCDGFIKMSLHNNYPATAFDICVIEDGKAIWTPRDYIEAGVIGLEIGLNWGIKLNKNTIDYPHYQEYEKEIDNA